MRHRGLPLPVMAGSTNGGSDCYCGVGGDRTQNSPEGTLREGKASPKRWELAGQRSPSPSGRIRHRADNASETARREKLLEHIPLEFSRGLHTTAHQRRGLWALRIRASLVDQWTRVTYWGFLDATR